MNRCTLRYATLFFALSASLPCFGQTAPRTFVRTWTATAPEGDAGAVAVRPLRDVKQSTAYFDGLGRPEQTVARKGSLSSGGRFDVVVPNEYDAFGREAKTYLPYVAATADGLYKTDALADQQGFNQGWFAAQGENSFYGKTTFEPSPLNRITETYAPGASWAGSEGSASPHSVKTKYWVNTSDDEVKIWSVTEATTPGDFGNYSVSANPYSAGELYKTVTEDEGSRQVLEFKDKEGRVILKKVQLAAGADDGSGRGYNGWLCTYYIYDDLGELRCVVQPKGVELLRQNGWAMTALSGDILTEQCFRYEYDARGRMIVKKVPGAGAVQMVYDERDRLVMSQDGNLRMAQQWLITVYENDLNRPVATYKITDPSASTTDPLNAANATAHRDAANHSSAYPTVGNYSNELLTETHYDDYTGLPAGFSTSSLANSGYASYLTAAASAPEYAEPLTASSATKGLVTWTRVKVLGEDNFLYTCNLYDEKVRVIQVQSLNYSGGMDVITTQYSFSGQVLRSHVSHQKGGSSPQHYEVATKNSYDDLGRLTGIEKSVQGSAWKPVSALTYDALGQLKTKVLSPDYNNGAGLETMSYDYNVRGWLLGANRDFSMTPGNNAHYFGFDLGYDKQGIRRSDGSSIAGYDQPAYNGNIAGTVWKSRGDDVLRRYDFTYDNVNRLMGAEFIQYSNGSWNDQDMDYSVENLGYDENGNINSMRQRGWKLGAPAHNVVDDLLYTYKKYGVSNQLQNVIDQSNDATTKLGDFRSSQGYLNSLGGNKDLSLANAYNDYSYDENGNLKKDRNKDIGTATVEGIAYNHLNLPQTITVEGKGSIDYVYDAAGTKLKKVVHETGQPDKTTLYLFGTYEDDGLQFLPLEEGRIRPQRDANNAITGFTYDYMLKDHLGNVRMVLTEEQKQDVYPAATFEDAALSGEQVYYENVDVAREEHDLDGNPSTPPNKVQSLRKNTTSVGAGKLLKVMAGDRLHLKVDYFIPVEATDNTGADGVGSAITSLFTLLNGGAVPTLKDGAASITNSLNTPGNDFTAFLQPQTTGALSSLPKAYLNILFFDEQFHFVPQGSEAVQLTTQGSLTTLTRVGSAAKEAQKSGYVYIYLSNESNNTVFFDNLQITGHEHSAIVEETHYYPFGLTMAGISSKATCSIQNRRKFNDGTELENNEFSDGSGLELYATPFRGYDPQLGRFWQIDAMASDYEAWSPYAFSFNNPVNLNDPSGLKTDSLRAPDGEMVADKGKMNGVMVTSSQKNNWDVYAWMAFADRNRHRNYGLIVNALLKQGVNEEGINMFWNAFQSYEYRQRLAVIEAGWREFVEDALLEGATWAVGGALGKAVSVGFRMYKFSRAAGTIRVFWSTGGDKAIKFAAESYAKIHGGITLNMTVAGRALEFIDPILPKSISGPLWDRLSASFARNAVGEVHAFQNAVTGVSRASTWAKYEYPNLNLSRVNINFHY